MMYTSLVKYAVLLSGTGSISTLPLFFSLNKGDTSEGGAVNVSLSEQQPDQLLHKAATSISLPQTSEKQELKSRELKNQELKNSANSSGTKAVTKVSEQQASQLRDIEMKDSTLSNLTTTLKTEKIDESKPSHQAYKKFVTNLLSIIEGIVWRDSPFQNLWIDQVFVQMPKNKFQGGATLLRHWTSHKFFNTPDFKTSVESSESELDVFDISVNPAQTSILRPSSGDRAPADLTHAVQIMSNLVHTFLTEDWTPGNTSVRSRSQDSNFVYSPISIRTSETGDNKGYWVRNILRFVREYEGKYYYCDIYFTSGMEKNMLRSSYVYYKDQNWREGAYYQANGDWGYYGKNIGGNGSLLWWHRKAWNNIDTEFSTLFDDSPDRTQKLWKWFEVISNCLSIEECRETLHSSSNYIVLKQREEKLSRDDSYKQDVYKRIHPFSRIYYQVSENLNNQSFDFTL